MSSKKMEYKKKLHRIFVYYTYFAMNKWYYYVILLLVAVLLYFWHKKYSKINSQYESDDSVILPGPIALFNNSRDHCLWFVWDFSPSYHDEFFYFYTIDCFKEIGKNNPSESEDIYFSFVNYDQQIKLKGSFNKLLKNIKNSKKIRVKNNKNLFLIKDSKEVKERLHNFIKIIDIALEKELTIWLQLDW